MFCNAIIVVCSVHRTIELFRLLKKPNAFVPGAFEGRSTKAADGLGMNDGNINFHESESCLHVMFGHGFYNCVFQVDFTMANVCMSFLVMGFIDFTMACLHVMFVMVLTDNVCMSVLVMGFTMFAWHFWSWVSLILQWHVCMSCLSWFWTMFACQFWSWGSQCLHGIFGHGFHIDFTITCWHIMFVMVLTCLHIIFGH